MASLAEQGEQLTLAPEEFTKTYGWKNDPTKVSLKAESRKRRSERLTVEHFNGAGQPIETWGLIGLGVTARIALKTAKARANVKHTFGHRLGGVGYA